MNKIPLLEELAIIAVLGVAVSALLARLRLPTVAGLLAAGALLGPFGLRLVKDIGSIEALAEMGVVLLLFTIGLDFSFERVRHILRRVVLGGLVQVGATLGATALVAVLFGQTPGRAIFYGFIVAMSSTAIVLRALADRGELDAPHGRFVVGALIFQDLCVIPMVLLIPVLGRGDSVGIAIGEIGLAMGKAALVVAGAFIAARFVVPRLLRWVDASRSREAFLLAILAICVGTAWATSLAGLSLALGAFLGGMVVAGTEFQHRAMGDMMPLRDALVSVFFVSLGMLFDPGLLITRPVLVALLLLGFVAGKALLATLSAILLRTPPRAAWLAGVGLGQFGEFGFVLLRLGQTAGLTDRATASALLSAGIISMFLAPVLIRLAPRLIAAERLLGPLSRLVGVRQAKTSGPADAPERHAVIIGYGIAGKLVARGLASCSIPHTVLEMNAETVRQARATGEPVIYADATSAQTLARVNIAGARVAAVLINDPQAALRVTDTLHRVAPEVPVIIRTRYLADRPQLLELGASDVVAEEVEGSVEVLCRLLRRLEVPRNVIHDLMREAREQLQTSDRKITIPRSRLAELSGLSELKIESVLLTQMSCATGHSSAELDIRRKTGALIVAIRRGNRLQDQLDPALPFAPGDLVYLVGSGEAIRAAIDLLDRSSDAGPLPSGV